MYAKHSPHTWQLTGVSFSTYSTDEIRRLSVKRLVNPVTFDTMLHPTLGGLYDAALGPMDNKDRCSTCSLLGPHCPGHVGHIELPFPVFHPIFFSKMFQLLKGMCRYCHHLNITKVQGALFAARLKLVDFGLVLESKELLTAVNSYTGPGDDIEEAEDDDKKKEPKKAKVSEDDMLWFIEEKLQELLLAADVDDSKTPDFRCKTRAVDEHRREITLEFFKLLTVGRKCGVCVLLCALTVQRCKGIRTTLTQENSARIFITVCPAYVLLTYSH